MGDEDKASVTSERSEDTGNSDLKLNAMKDHLSITHHPQCYNPYRVLA